MLHLAGIKSNNPSNQSTENGSDYDLGAIFKRKTQTQLKLKLNDLLHIEGSTPYLLNFYDA